MNKQQKIYFDNVDVKNRLNSGENLILTHDIEEIDNPAYQSLYKAIVDLSPDSIYQNEFGLGQHLVNLRRLFPYAKIGGCTNSQLGIVYGHKHFKLKDCDLLLEVGDLSTTDGKYDVVISVHNFESNQTKNSEQVQKMLKKGRTVVLLEPSFDLSFYNGEYTEY